ncbi:MAG: ribosomal protein S18-alanine N-acetyltransferase [Clostridia bacterium]|nr:ribosomal protein S18-alanine N-acetyltransferase [Clostridia bacterium]
MDIQYAVAEKKHVDMMYEIEKQSFITPWSHKSIYNDVVNNTIAVYLVALDGEQVVGYLGVWHIIDEAHITTVAVKKEYQRKHIAETMFRMMFERLDELDIHAITLEVREHNDKAINLYNKLGFTVEGKRNNYYSDTNENALIMWKSI